MARIKPLISWPLVVLLILSPLLLHLGLAEGFTAAKVLRVTGVAQVTRAGTTGRDRLGQGDKLFNGDTLEVTRNSEVVLELPNGSQIRVGSSTRVTIGSVDVRRADITAWYGSVLSAIDRSADPDYNYRVSTPTASASVRGTIFLTEVAEEDGASTVQVLRGEVVTTSPAAPGEVVVTAGMRTSVAPGVAPTAPIALTAAEITALESLSAPFMEIGATGAGAGAGVGAGAAAGGGTVAAGSSSWLLWTLIGVAVAGGVTGGLILAGGDDGDGGGSGGGDLPVPPPPPD